MHANRSYLVVSPYLIPSHRILSQLHLVISSHHIASHRIASRYISFFSSPSLYIFLLFSSLFLLPSSLYLADTHVIKLNGKSTIANLTLEQQVRFPNQGHSTDTQAKAGENGKNESIWTLYFQKTASHTTYTRTTHSSIHSHILQMFYPIGVRSNHLHGNKVTMCTKTESKQTLLVEVLSSVVLAIWTYIFLEVLKRKCTKPIFFPTSVTRILIHALNIHKPNKQRKSWSLFKASNNDCWRLRLLQQGNKSLGSCYLPQILQCTPQQYNQAQQIHENNVKQTPTTLANTECTMNQVSQTFGFLIFTIISPNWVFYVKPSAKLKRKQRWNTWSLNRRMQIKLLCLGTRGLYIYIYFFLEATNTHRTEHCNTRDGPQKRKTTQIEHQKQNWPKSQNKKKKTKKRKPLEKLKNEKQQIQQHSNPHLRFFISN